MSRCLALLLICGLFSHCSIYKAVTSPVSLPLERVHVGAQRSDVIAVLGAPTSIDLESRERIETYNFVHGNTGASKLRIFPYVFADIFTIGLAELVLWPLEMTMPKLLEGQAVVVYTPEDVARTVTIRKRDGTPWPEN